MRREEIYQKLHTTDGIASLLMLTDFSPIYEEADRVRRENVGDVVHLRAIIEFSNVCRRQCRYCGLNRENESLPRFRMSREEIVQTASEAVAAGYRTIVLQSGEDAWFTAERLGEIIADIKGLTAAGQAGITADPSADIPADAHPADFPTAARVADAPAADSAADAHPESIHPAVTVSCGERPEEDYRYWREKGADRYLLKHETANPELYGALHPCGTLKQRIDCLKTLRSLGYETGSGFMVGLPGQMPETLARDLLLLKGIPCKMAGIGPFIANPKTPLAGARNGDPELARRCVAIARLLLPEANLPLTTALSVLSEKEKGPKGGKSDDTDGSCIAQGSGDPDSAGKPDNDAGGGPAAAPGIYSAPQPPENPFAFGANVIMKKVTPDRYKAMYEIYPAEFKPTNITEDRRMIEQTIRYYGRDPL